MNFEEYYKRCIDSIKIPQYDLNRIITDNNIIKKKIMIQYVYGIAAALVLLVFCSSLSVYTAYGIIQKNINKTSGGILVSDHAGEEIVHDYGRNTNDETTSVKIRESINDNTVENFELLFFDSWDKIEDLFSFNLPIPDLKYDVLISAQKMNELNIAALYTVSEQQEINIQYMLFDNSNWEYGMDYSGNIIERTTFTNIYGYSFELVQVDLKDDIYSYFVIAFDNILVRLQFKNISKEEQENVLNQFDFKEALNENSGR